ncbi:MAG: UDP-3-O-[3-hydroxymyristoyl] N-acetylglucosamine deacetylase [Chlamydiales bacterium]|nr:UDP-3-O-[3-hydroxymyristoyl] N-acetylglucosamine deacetylase [Chlamydiales bacterium]
MHNTPHTYTRTKQRTLQRSVSISGVGVFTGEKTTLRLCPAEADTGILFQRLDLPHKPFLPATLDHVQGTPRCTMIGIQGVLVQTVEHLLSALKAYQIDNVLIEIRGPEVPILDGSARGFVELIEQAGVCVLGEERTQGKLEAPVFWSQKETHLVAIPSDEYRVSYTLHYPHSDFIGSQFYSIVVDETRYKEEIASSRTFSLYEDVAPLIEKGFLKGGSFESGILIKDNAVANPGGLRFKDEMVRHKVLDLIGDLSLMAISFSAHIIAIRSGHTSNIAFAKELAKYIKMENA